MRNGTIVLQLLSSPAVRTLYEQQGGNSPELLSLAHDNAAQRPAGRWNAVLEGHQQHTFSQSPASRHVFLPRVWGSQYFTVVDSCLIGDSNEGIHGNRSFCSQLLSTVPCTITTFALYPTCSKSSRWLTLCQHDRTTSMPRMLSSDIYIRICCLSTNTQYTRDVTYTRWT